jgi:hypothetical protein
MGFDSSVTPVLLLAEHECTAVQVRLDKAGQTIILIQFPSFSCSNHNSKGDLVSYKGGRSYGVFDENPIYCGSVRSADN